MTGGARGHRAPALLLLAVAICCVTTFAHGARRVDPWAIPQVPEQADQTAFQRTRGRQPTTVRTEGVVAVDGRGGGGGGRSRGGNRSWRDEPQGNRVAERKTGDEETELDPHEASPSINRPRSQAVNEVAPSEVASDGGRGGAGFRREGRRGRGDGASERRVEPQSRSRVAERRSGRQRNSSQGGDLDQPTSASSQRSRSQPARESEAVEVKSDLGRGRGASSRRGESRATSREQIQSRRTADRRTLNEINSISGILEDGATAGSEGESTVTSRGNSRSRSKVRGSQRSATTTPTEPTLPGGIRESDNYPEEFKRKLRDGVITVESASSTTAVAWEAPRRRGDPSRSVSRSLIDEETGESSPSIPSRDSSQRSNRPTSARGRGNARAGRVENSAVEDRGTSIERNGRRGGNRRGEIRGAAPSPVEEEDLSRRRNGGNRRGPPRRGTTALSSEVSSTAAPLEASSSTISAPTLTQETSSSTERISTSKPEVNAPEASAKEPMSLVEKASNGDDSNNSQDKTVESSAPEKAPESQSTETAPSSTALPSREAAAIPSSRLNSSGGRRGPTRGSQRSRSNIGAATVETEAVEETNGDAKPRDEVFRRRGRQRVTSLESTISSRSSPRESSRDTSSRDSPRDSSRDSSRDPFRDTPRDSSRNAFRESFRDTSRNTFRETRRRSSTEEQASSTQAPPPRGRGDYSRGRNLQRSRTTEIPSDNLLTRASEAVVTVTSAESSPGEYYRIPGQQIPTTEPPKREETRMKLAALTSSKKTLGAKYQATKKIDEVNHVVSKVSDDIAKENTVGGNIGEKLSLQRPVYNPRKSFSRATSEASVPVSNQGDVSVPGVVPHRFSAKQHHRGGSTTATPAYVATVPTLSSGLPPRVSTSAGQVVLPARRLWKLSSARENS